MSDVDTTREQLLKASCGHTLRDANNIVGDDTLTFCVDDIESLLSHARAQAFDDLLEAMPEKRATAAPRGKVMPFNESCINHGFNEYHDQVTATIHQLKSPRRKRS